MGFISGFVSGAAKATSDLALFNLKEKADRERLEAEAVRRRALTEYEQGMEDARLDKKMGFEKEENRLDRESEERRAGMKSSRGSSAKVIKSTDDEGNEIFLRYDPETDEMVKVGRGGAGVSSQVSIEQARDMARREAEDKAGLFRTDKTDFGGSREAWINRRALEIMSGGQAQASSDAPRKQKVGGVEYPKGAVDELMRDSSPEAISEFNEVFGQGAAERVLGKKPSQGSPATKPAAEKPAAPKQKPAKKSTAEHIAEIEARLKADDDLKAPGSGGIGARAIKAKIFPLGLIGRKRLEQELAQLRKEIGTTAK